MVLGDEALVMWLCWWGVGQGWRASGLGMSHVCRPCWEGVCVCVCVYLEVEEGAAARGARHELRLGVAHARALG
jgi:hypothetical protein